MTMITDHSTKNTVLLKQYYMIRNINDVTLPKEWQRYIIHTDDAVPQITMPNYTEIAPLPVIQRSSFTHVCLSYYTVPLATALLYYSVL